MCSLWAETTRKSVDSSEDGDPTGCGNAARVLRCETHARAWTPAPATQPKSNLQQPPPKDNQVKIGVFCSGGDAPGMNACVRGVVRCAAANDHEVVGIRRGYQGLLEEDFFRDREGAPRLHPRNVAGWGQLGGARLRSSRSKDFRSADGQQRAADVLRKHKIDALIPIGGDGTFHGCVKLSSRWDGSVIGCPGTIDNDLVGTDFTIGFSTAVQTAVEAVDKIRDTAESHERMFLIEVMGRHSGFIAVHTAIAGGAEAVCIPETPTDLDTLLTQLRLLKRRGKSSIMLVVAEGDEGGGAAALNAQLQAVDCPFSTRVVVLGHLQRGGSPSPDDRILGSQLGAFAVEAIQSGHSGCMAGRLGNELTLTPFADTYRGHKPIPASLLELLEILAN